MRPLPMRARACLTVAALLTLSGAVTAQTPTAARPATAPTAPPAAPAAQPAAPGTPVYNVEIIVFRALSALGPPEDWSTETGTQTPATTDTDTPAVAAGAAAQGRFVRALAPTEFQLNDIEPKLRASGGYAVVAHAGWSQTASPWGNHTGIPVQRLGIEAPELMGAVSLERGQFLHLGMQLSFT